MLKKGLLILILITFHAHTNAQLNTDRILTNGRNALYFEDYVLAIQYFNQVIRIRPFLAEPYLFRGIAKIQLGDYEGGEADVSEAISRNPFLPEAYYARGFTRMRAGAYKEAESDFNKALEFSPTSRHLILSRMDARERMGEYEAALKDLESFLRLNPRAKELLYDKGRIQLAMKDTVGAKLTFNQFIESDTTSPAGWSARALLRLQLKDYEGAYEDYTKAIKNKSTFSGDFINRGIINVEARRFMEALSDYDEAVRLDPAGTLAYLNRGILRSNLGDDNNALKDFERVLELDSTIIEARYSKALLELKLRNYRNAITDFQIVINRHPFFLPAYWGVADAYAGMNNSREAFRYRQLASDIEKNRDSMRDRLKEDLEARNKIAENRPQGNTSRRTNLFNRNVTQNQDESEFDSRFNNERRGAVQRRMVEVVSEKNFALTYYSRPEAIRRTNLYHLSVDLYNRKRVLKGDLRITASEVPLTSDLINRHFENIDYLNTVINVNTKDADLFFQRAMDFALVQELKSAIDDLSKAIELKNDFMLAYFMRANTRFKLVDYQRNIRPEISDMDRNIEQDHKLDFEMIMRDLKRVIELQPDFPFSYYNKANIQATLKDFSAAIINYSKAIEVDQDFAEAYLNRGLTYLFIGEDAKGLADLSKAGELGIFKAYNLIQQFK